MNQHLKDPHVTRKPALISGAAPLIEHRTHGVHGPDGQLSGRAAKSRLAFLYHPIPDTGCFHLFFISFKALSCVLSPAETVSFKCLSCAFMTSSAVSPWSGKSHGPPNCLHVIVFMGLASLMSPDRQLGRVGDCPAKIIRAPTRRVLLRSCSAPGRPAMAGSGRDSPSSRHHAADGAT